MSDRKTSPMNVDTTKLAERAAAGDVNAFAALYDLFFARVYNYARYRCEDDDTADDLTAQIFERLLAKVPAYSPQKGIFEAWLFALARSVIVDYHRARKLRAFLPWESVRQTPDGSISPEEHSIHSEFEAQLLKALPCLADRERDLLGLKYAWGLKNNQIADLTGIGESSVGIILYRAINRLRTLLDSESPTHPIVKDMRYE
jgi:RNA polymerase sigma-70 factor, ECF subfamily